MGFKPDLDDQLVSFSALTLLVGSSGLKIVPKIIYNVLSGTFSLYTTLAWFTVQCACAGPAYFEKVFPVR